MPVTGDDRERGGGQHNQDERIAQLRHDPPLHGSAGGHG
jgi:hypothetical protein